MAYVSELPMNTKLRSWSAIPRRHTSSGRAHDAHAPSQRDDADDQDGKADLEPAHSLTEEGWTSQYLLPSYEEAMGNFPKCSIFCR